MNEEKAKEIYAEIYDTFKKHGVPVDKFGHFFSNGFYTVDKLPNPQFSEMDYLLAKMIKIDDKLQR